MLRNLFVFVCLTLGFLGAAESYSQELPPIIPRTELFGNPEKDAEFLKSRSPLFKINNIKIPILIGQDANDARVNQAESEQMVAALNAKNLPYEYVLFPDEGHGFAKPKNRLKFNAIAEKFLAKHLGGRCEAQASGTQKLKQKN